MSNTTDEADTAVPIGPPLKALLYRLVRFVVRLVARPTVTGEDNYPHQLTHPTTTQDSAYEVVYVLHHRALTDLAILEQVCQKQGFTSPFRPLGDHDGAAGTRETGRFFPLLRASAGRITMREHSQRLARLVQMSPDLRQQVLLIPVSIFWGRAMSGQGSIFKILTSEDWAASGRFKRLLNLLINRRNIYVHTGRPIALAEVAPEGLAAELAIRRTARLLRVRFRAQKVTALGPDFSHRRTLVEQVISSRVVKQAIDNHVHQTMSDLAQSSKPPKNPARTEQRLRNRAQKEAQKHARTIASDMSHPTIRVLSSLLSWFWHKIYDGINITGLESLEAVSATHTLVYVPSHRSHIDYLLLSYLLYHRGFMIPHIVAGDNLNQPLLGPILRRGGAMFMRRSFRDDPVYTAVFSEYLYLVYRRGHCVEFFPEGGRTRTGRLLPAKYGLLKIAVDHQQRGLPKPIAFIPVYFGYEKVVEGSSYLSELRGANKKNESLSDVVRNIRLIRQNFGSVDVNFGQAIKLDHWLQSNSADALHILGDEIMQGINARPTLNPVNLVALVTLATANSAIEEANLQRQIELYQQLIGHLFSDGKVSTTKLNADEIIAQVESLGLLNRYSEAYGEVLGHEPFAAVLMTWYRNNVVHALALPSLVACFMINRRRALSRTVLTDMVNRVYPYLAQELTIAENFLELDSVLASMQEFGLLQQTDSSGNFLPLTPEDPGHFQLNLLAQLVSQTLERMFIVIHQLQQQSHTRDSLEQSSALIAQKISRFYGINAPEFSDQRLFNGFIDHLIATGVVTENSDGTLFASPVIGQVLRMARHVIDVKIRYGVSSAIHNNQTVNDRHQSAPNAP